MAVQGNMIWFDRGLLKLVDGTVKLYSDTLKAALLTSSQAMARAFVGTSTDARYADLTGELTTANGYTAGGFTLTSVALSRVSTTVSKFTSAAASWTLTGGGITFKYMVIYDNTSSNKDLIAFCDMDTGGGSVSPLAGAYAINPDATNGFGIWSQP